MSGLRRIVSGGQTGVDRAALDAAMAAGIDHGGRCPRGRRAEDGVIPARYELEELSSASYRARTEANVADADATLILARGALTGGTALTLAFARRQSRPHLVVDLDVIERDDAVTEILEWLERTGPAVLNIAGPRESGAPGIGAEVRIILERVLRCV